MNKNQFLYELQQALEPVDQDMMLEILADFEEHFANGIQQGRTEDQLAQELGQPSEIARAYKESLADGQTHQTIRSSWQHSDFLSTNDNASVTQANENSPTISVGQSSGYDQHSADYTADSFSQINGQTQSSGQTQYSRQAQSTGQTQTQTADQIQMQAAASPTKQNNASHINESMLVLIIILNLLIGIPLLIALISTLFGFWAAAGGIGVAGLALFVIAVFEAGMTGLVLFLFGLSLASLSIIGLILMYYITKGCALLIRRYFRWNRQVVTGGSAS